MSVASIAEQVMALRKRRRFGQKDLEPLTGLKQPQIARLENGHDVRLSTLERLLKALGANLVVVPRERLSEVQALLERSPGEPGGPSPHESPADEDYRPYADLEVPDDD